MKLRLNIIEPEGYGIQLWDKHKVAILFSNATSHS